MKLYAALEQSYLQLMLALSALTLAENFTE